MTSGGPNACAELARLADEIAGEQPTAQQFLVHLGHDVAGIPRGRLAVVALLAGGRSRIKGGGFRAELRDHTAGQARHFAGIARSVTVLGADRTRWISVHLRRDAPDKPDGRLTELAIGYATALLDGSLPVAGAGDWIRENLCGR